MRRRSSRALLLVLLLLLLVQLPAFTNAFMGSSPRSTCRRRPILLATKDPPLPAASPEEGGRGRGGVPPLNNNALLLLAATGGVVGPVVDGIHNSVLLAYDIFPVEPLGLFKTSLLIPPLLAVAYALLGGVLPNIVQRVLHDDDAAAAAAAADTSAPLPLVRLPVGPQALAAVASTVAIIASSKVLHESAPASVSLPCLAAAALAQWALLDGTLASLVLAATASVGGPIAEIPLMVWGHAWHYLTPDYFPLGAVTGDLPGAGLEAITGPCYFAVTTDAIALYRYYYASLLRGGGKDDEASL